MTIDEDTVIGRMRAHGREYTIHADDLDEKWQKHLAEKGCVATEEQFEAAMADLAIAQDRIAELEADLERVADERDEALFQCKKLGDRGDELEAKLAKAEAALEMADTMLTDYRWLCSDAGHPDPIIGEKYQKRREAMK